MKKTLQVVTGVSPEYKDDENGNRTFYEKNVSAQLKENFAKCTGFFIVPVESGSTLSGITIGLTIDQQEILPKGCDVSLFTVTDSVGRDEAKYDFKEENIPARSADVVLTVNSSKSISAFNVYFVLENL